jgi:NTP pyrophosphatase (non-canonical NTP hydrolase)
LASRPWFNTDFENFSEYQEFVETTVTHRDDIYPVLGLAGETGEFVELVKKAWRKDGPDWVASFDREKATSELGDILWYVTRIANILNLRLLDIAEYNVEKLLDRQANGKK